MPRMVDDLMKATGLGIELCKAGIIAGQLPGYFIKPDEKSAGRYLIPDRAFERFCDGEWHPRVREFVVEQDRGCPECGR